MNLDQPTIITAILILLGAAIVAGLGYYARKTVGLQQWQTALEYAELVVNSIDQLYDTGLVMRNQRLETATQLLRSRFPWLATEEAHTMIHGWLRIIKEQRAELLTPAVLPTPTDKPLTSSKATTTR